MKVAVALAIILAGCPVAAHAQLQDRQLEDERPSPFEDSLDQADRERGASSMENTIEARQAIESYGKCVAERKPGEAKRLLMMDFTSSRYRTGLRLLADDARRNCANASVGRGNVMRSASLLFAGAMAEALVETGETALNARLARGAGNKATSFAPTDAVAQCLARSLPDQTAALFATSPGSDEETAAAAPLAQAVPACARAAGLAARVELSVAAMRAMIATASFRLLAAVEGSS